MHAMQIQSRAMFKQVEFENLFTHIRNRTRRRATTHRYEDRATNCLRMVANRIGRERERENEHESENENENETRVKKRNDIKPG